MKCRSLFIVRVPDLVVLVAELTWLCLAKGEPCEIKQLAPNETRPSRIRLFAVMMVVIVLVEAVGETPFPPPPPDRRFQDSGIVGWDSSQARIG